jgi:hypothetical protein
MVQNTLVIAIDLRTGAITAMHARVRDSLRNGKMQRDKLNRSSEVKDWPGCVEGATGNVCVPTDLIYRISDQKLLFWGYGVQEYLDDDYREIPKTQVYVVETPKLLLPDPDEANLPSPAPSRYRQMRRELFMILKKQPEDVFEDLMRCAIEHILNNCKRRYIKNSGLHNHHVELALAFRSGWQDSIHTKVSQIASRAVKGAIQTHGLTGIKFDIEDVYTVSETLSGIKEWLRDTVSEASSSEEFDQQKVNLDELDVSLCEHFAPFLVVLIYHRWAIVFWPSTLDMEPGASHH